MVKKILLIPIFLCFALPSYAEDNQKEINLTLQECIEIALKNNLELKLESYNPKIKELDLQKIYDEFGLSIGFRPNLENSIRPTSNSFISGGSVLREFSQNYDFFARKKFLSNGELSLQFQNSILNTNSTRVDFNPIFTPRLSFSLEQPILKNAFNGYKRVNIGENENLASELRLKSKAIDIVSRTQEAFWNYVLNKERVKVLENSLNLTQELLEINKAKEKEGATAKLDIVITEANMTSRQESLLQGKRSLQESEDALKRLLNPNQSIISWSSKITPDYNLQMQNINTNFEEILTTSLKNRPDFNAALIDTKNLEIQKEIANKNRLPDLSLNGNAGLNGLDKTYLSSINNLFSFNTYFWNVGLNFEIPVQGNINETEYKQTLLNLEKQMTNINNLKQGIVNEVRTYIRDVDTNKQRVETNSKSKDLFKQQVIAETEKFNLGLSTNYQVLQYQRDFEDASLNEINSKIDYIKSINNLEKAQGLSLEKNNIIWDEQ